MSTRPATHGAFKKGEFGAVLSALHSSATNGRLDVDGSEIACSLFLSQGTVGAISAGQERHRLGAWLAARGVLDEQQLALLLLKQPAEIPLGAYLIEEGILTAERLAEELQLRAAALVGMLLVSSGRYALVEGAEQNGAGAQSLDLSTTALLLAAARATDGATLDEIVDASESLLERSSAAFERARDAVLNPHEAFLLSRLDRGISAAALQHLVPIPEEQLKRSLAALVIAGLVQLRGQSEVRSAVLQADSDATVQAAEAKAKAVPAPSRFPEDLQRERAEITRLSAEIEDRDFYRRLGLARGATQTQIHTAFRELSRMYQPTRAEEEHLAGLREDLELVHSAIAKAYAVLIDPRQKERYDQHVRALDAGERSTFSAAGSAGSSARRELVAANIQRANELVRAGSVGEAVSLLDQAVRFDPQPDTLLTLARLELKNPMWSQRALNRLKQALSIDPTYTDAWLELAEFWQRRRNWEKQKECLRRVLEYEPENIPALEALRRAESR